MIRASTPKHTFIFPVDPETRFSVIQITYSQDGENLLVKGKEDLTFRNAGTEEYPIYEAYYELTQEETKLFRGNIAAEQRVADVLIQVRALAADDGKVYTSKPMRARVLDVLNDEVLSDDEPNVEEPNVEEPSEDPNDDI